jgi:hypothetical protein
LIKTGRHTTLLLLFLSLMAHDLVAQRFLPHKEIGFWVGGSHYMGDLNERFTFINIIRPAGGLIFQHNFSERWGWRNTASYGRIYANDKFSGLQNYQQRNLHFRSDIAEINSQFVFNFLPFEIGGETPGFIFPFSPYMFWGLGMFYFNPKAELNGSWIALKNLDTEGQGTARYQRVNYRRLQANMPFGFGIKAGLSKKASIGFEWGLRKTWTDYLDDVSTTYPDYYTLRFERGEEAAALSDPSLEKPSDNPAINSGKQRGNAKTKDWYSFFGVSFTFKLENPKGKCPSYISGK